MHDLIADWDTWVEWNNAHLNAEDADRLAALREYIVATARQFVHSCTYDAAWANKKFAKLGIVERIDADSTYVLEAPVTGTVTISVYASDRTKAAERFAELTAGLRTATVTSPAVQGAPVFTSGPEDPQVLADDDAPQTVDATLTALREIILLGHIAGPKICREEADDVLESFGLAPIPPRKTFTVAVPVEAVMKTTVEAYDEDSARRVAGWRWDNARTGYEVDHVTDTDAPLVAPVVA